MNNWIETLDAIDGQLALHKNVTLFLASKVPNPGLGLLFVWFPIELIIYPPR